MKFVFFGYDFSLNVFDALVEAGHVPLGICTFECDNTYNFNTQILQRAQDLCIPAMIRPPSAVHIDDFIAQGAQLFFAAGYPHKIPPIDEAKAYGVNMHPSYLPMGRGLAPTPYIIMDAPQAGGMSLHKITDSFDEGDILYQERLEISPRETVESYSTRAALLAPKLAVQVLADLAGLWNDAKPQDESAASYFPPPDDSLRMIDWNMDVARIDKIARAFGRLGALCVLDGQVCLIPSLDIWSDSHDYAPGAIVRQTPREVTVAAGDGFVCLKEIHMLGAAQ